MEYANAFVEDCLVQFNGVRIASSGKGMISGDNQADNINTSVNKSTDGKANPTEMTGKKPENELQCHVGDITELPLDAIVNAANCSLLGGGGVDGAIHQAAGRELLEECRTLNGCMTGEAKITKGYRLPAKYVIHTVGPIYEGRGDEPRLLYNCYYNSLNLAAKHNLHSIGFPAISTGVYGYPKEEAAKVALAAISKWFDENRDYGMYVLLVCFSDADYEVYKKALKN